MNTRLIRLLGAACALAIPAGCDQAAPLSVDSSRTTRPAELALAEDSPLPADFEAPPPRPTPVYSQDVAPLLDRYCLGCHGRDAAEGGVILDAFGGEIPAGAKGRPLLLRVAAVLRSESMPPEEEPRPDQDERETLEAWLDAALGAEDVGTGTGRVTIRRLNRVEYNATIRDLIGVDLQPAEDFPADDTGYGFDNIAEVLATPPVLVEMELAAAESVIEAAFRSPAARDRIMSPPADTIPLAFRKYTAPVRTPREDKIFRLPGRTVDPELARQQRIYDILRGFADRAFRRPATHDEVTRLLTTALSAEKDGEEPEAALRLALQAVLASPQFFFRLEQVRDPGPGPSGDFDLAARLSYFLWSSLPDAELFQLAARGELCRAGTLRAQVRRMLADPRAQALAAHFAGQWLQTRRLVEVAPDPALYPEFDESLRSAMIRETQLFCRSIQEEDRSVLDFLDADYTFVNERLARHYGIAGVSGESFRRVSLAGTPRAGVLTQASILAVTSNPTRTSPVKRGKWILENVLGTPPAPPPSGVEALKEGQAAGSADTLREQMERHRSDPNCATCHGRMDPLGFALENFDAVGAWRTVEHGRAIDATGRLPAGREFRGAEGLRAVLRTRQDAFARCLAEKMLIYATGRGLGRPDRRTVDQIVARLKSDGYRFSALVLAVVESHPFLEPAQTGGQP
jgi:hypothetical protein